MEVLQRKDQFSDVKPRSLLSETRFLLEMPKQFTPTLEIRYEIEVCVRLEAEFEPN